MKVVGIEIGLIVYYFLMIMVVAPLFMKDSNINNIAHISGFIIGFIISIFYIKKKSNISLGDYYGWLYFL